MKGISGYEKVILLITCGCLIAFSGWFLNQKNVDTPYQVVIIQNEREDQQVQEYRENDWPESLLPGERININTAQEEDLQRLPGVGEKLAKEIVLYREKYGRFRYVDELIYVSGFGEAALERLREYISVSAG